MGAYLLFAKRSTLLGKANFPFSWCEFPIHSGPLLKVNCPCAPCVSLIPHTHSPHTEHLFLYTKTTLTSPILLSGIGGIEGRKQGVKEGKIERETQGEGRYRERVRRREKRSKLNIPVS
jgi:hypothetical protein